MGYLRKNTSSSSISPIAKVSYSTTLFSLPPELRFPIISNLTLNDALNLRLTCRSLNVDVLNLYPFFEMSITGDSLTLDQLKFLNCIHLKRITFKRVAKPIPSSRRACFTDDFDQDLPSVPSISSPCWICTRKKVYSGPCQYFQVGGIQIRSLTAPSVLKRHRDMISEASMVENSVCRTMEAHRTLYDYNFLRKYLTSVAGEDIFKHISL